ncbi:putative 26S proteasome regulatory subunit [Polyrhizophydium stewartii]|uniref:26S proteasome regulatory subunit n=1 Tax=Polyrhizophydium stewartii TaxID=2732419 RepID=A0ABR4NCX1_9FUNG
MTTATHAEAVALAQEVARRRDLVEAQLREHQNVLASHNMGMSEPLVDSEGFPIAGVDIYAVRHARVAIIRLQNDHKALTQEMAEALHRMHELARAEGVAAQGQPRDERSEQAFARVNAVSPDSPCWEAGLQRGDMVLRFGSVSAKTDKPLTALVDLVQGSENKPLRLAVVRDGQRVELTVTPHKWSGRGLLGGMDDSIEPATPPQQQQQPLQQPPPAQRADTPEPPLAASLFGSMTGSTSSASSGGWGLSWGGLVKAVQKQSEAVIEVYKRDLGEFVSTVAAEGTQGMEVLARNLQTLAAGGTNQDDDDDDAGDLDDSLDSVRAAATTRTSESMAQQQQGEVDLAAASADEPMAASIAASSSAPVTPERVRRGVPPPPSSSAATATTTTTTDEKGLLDTFDEMAEQAEQFVGKRLMDLGTGLATGFSALITTVAHVTPGTSPVRGYGSSGQPVPVVPVKYDRQQELLNEMEQDETTYLVDPRDLVQVRAHMASSALLATDPEAYAQRFVEFEKAFDRVGKAGQIAVLLSEHAHVSRFFDLLVPEKVSDTDFWLRYYFRQSEIEREEAARRRLVDNATQAAQKDDDFKWDSEDDDDNPNNDDHGADQDVSDKTRAHSGGAKTVKTDAAANADDDGAQLQTPRASHAAKPAGHSAGATAAGGSSSGATSPSSHGDGRVADATPKTLSEDRSTESFEMVRDGSSFASASVASAPPRHPEKGEDDWGDWE